MGSFQEPKILGLDPNKGPVPISGSGPKIRGGPLVLWNVSKFRVEEDRVLHRRRSTFRATPKSAVKVLIFVKVWMPRGNSENLPET